MATLLQLCQPFDHAVMAAIQQLSRGLGDVYKRQAKRCHDG